MIKALLLLALCMASVIAYPASPAAIEPKAISQLSLPIRGIFIYSFQIQCRHLNRLPSPNKDLVDLVLTNICYSLKFLATDLLERFRQTRIKSLPVWLEDQILSLAVRCTAWPMTLSGNTILYWWSRNWFMNFSVEGLTFDLQAKNRK